MCRVKSRWPWPMTFGYQNRISSSLVITSWAVNWTKLDQCVLSWAWLDRSWLVQPVWRKTHAWVVCLEWMGPDESGPDSVGIIYSPNFPSDLLLCSQKPAATAHILRFSTLCCFQKNLTPFHFIFVCSSGLGKFEKAWKQSVFLTGLVWLSITVLKEKVKLNI